MTELIDRQLGKSAMIERGARLGAEQNRRLLIAFLLTDHLELHVLELPKLRGALVGMDEPALAAWRRFLASETDDELDGSNAYRLRRRSRRCSAPESERCTRAPACTVCANAAGGRAGARARLSQAADSRPLSAAEA